MKSMLDMSGAGAGRRNVRLLFTCAGRRVELITAFRRAARSLGLRPDIHVADTETHFAAACIADRAHRVPPTQSAGYIAAVLDLVRHRKIDMLIPLIDMDLVKLADARDEFARLSCAAMISAPRVVRTCRDKLLTYRFLSRHSIDTPGTWTPQDALDRKNHTFPYFLKPRAGSASKGNFIIRNRHDLVAMVPRVPEPIVQEFVAGIEHTLDVYAGFDGQPRCVVPRQRIEVRGGEVTKARTVKNPAIINMGVRVVEALAECVGLITIQLILTPDGRIRVIEINPRFGGGVPLAIHAGANFPKWLLAEWLGQKPRIRLNQFRDGQLMLRFHQSYFLNGSGEECRARQVAPCTGRKRPLIRP
jgi:carbamoyl-phosphate synthase large subunit